MKKILSLVMIVLLVVSTGLIFSSCDFLIPGIVDNTVYLSTAADVNNIRETLKESKYKYKLKNDIDLSEFDSWVPIFISESQYMQLDGVGFSITGLKMSYLRNSHTGLFSIYRGSIENLRLEVEIEGVKGSYTGSFVGQMKGASSKIVNCQSYGSIKCDPDAVSNASEIGGLVGWNDGGLIQNCENHVLIDAPYNGTVGGIAGYVTNVFAIKREQVGSIQNKEVNYYDYALGGVINCKNYGSISGGGNYVGGIIGYLKHTGNSIKHIPEWTKATNTYDFNTFNVADYVLTNTNLGKVISSGDYVGGIFGKAEFISIGSARYLTLANSGEVEGKKYVGGIAGQISVSQGTVIFKNYTNDGQVKGVEEVGGIFGSAITFDAVPSGVSLEISSCTNNVRPVGSSKVGGIVGSAMGESKTVQLYYTNKSRILIELCSSYDTTAGYDYEVEKSQNTIGWMDGW